MERDNQNLNPKAANKTQSRDQGRVGWVVVGRMREHKTKAV